MQRINFKFLLILIVVTVVTLGGLVFVRRFQVARNAGTKLEIARQRLEEGKLAQAMELFAQYVTLRPNDHVAFAEYSKLLLGRATAPDATRNDIARAFNALETAVRRNPEDDGLRQQLAEFQLRVGRATDAREHLDVLEQRLAGRPATAASPEADDAEDGSDLAQRVQLLKAGSFLGSNEFEEAAGITSKMVGFDLASREFAADFDDTGVPSDAYIVLAGILQERMAAPADARRVLEQLVARRGDDLRSWLALATWHRDRGELDDAARCLAKAGELEPDNAEYVFADFELALARRNWVQAAAIVERALELFPDEERTYRGVAAVAMQTGELARAEQVLLDGVERIPGRASLLLMLTDVLIQQGKIKQATETIARIRELYGSTSPAVGLLEGRMLVAESRWTDAKAKLEQVRPLVLGNADLIRQVDLYLGQCHAQLNEFDAQLEVNRRILSEDPGSLAARVGAAQALVSAGRTDQALAEFEVIAAALPGEQLVALPQIWYPLLQLRIGKQTALPQPERDWSSVDSLLEALERSGGVSASQLALLRAESLVRRGESPAARDLLSGLATADAEPQIWAALATLALRDDGPDEALAVLGRAPAAIRDSSPLLTVEAQAVARQPRETARAALAGIEKRATALPPAAAAKMLETLARLRLAMNDPEGAERLWREAAEKQPEDLQSREALLELAVATQNLDKARAAAAEIGRIAGPTSARSRVADAGVLVLEAREALAKAAAEEGRPPQELPAAVRSLLDRARGQLLEAEAERPGWTQIQVLAADVDTLRGDRAGAIARLTRAVASGPANPVVVRRLVALLYAANRLEEAQQAMALLGEEGTVGLERISAEAELQAGKLDEAVALAEQSVAGDTQNHEDLLWLGQLLARSGKTERAGEVLERAAEIAPDQAEVWLALFTHRLAASPGTAERALVTAADLLPEPRRQLALAQGYGMLGRTGDMERLLREALAGWPDDLETLRSLAAFEVQKGRAAEARALLDRILASQAEDAEQAKAWARRMVAELTAERGTYRQLEEALAILRQNRGRDGKAAVEDLGLEITLLAKRPEPASWRRAVVLLGELEAVQPLTIAQRLLRTQLRERLGLWPEARDELVALVAKRDTPPAYVAMLVEKLIEHGEVSTAKTWLRRLQQGTPESAITLALEAKLALAENDRPAAIARARQLMPGGIVGADNPAQLAAVGRLMEELGFPKAADRVFEQYAATGGNGAVARIEFLGRQGRGPEALDLLDAQWETLSLERALATAVQVVRLQPDEAAARPVAERVRTRIERAKREDPGSLVIRLLDAELASLEGRDSEAERIYRGLLAGQELDPGQRAIVANNLAFQLAESKSAAEARELIDGAIRELGPLPDLLDTRGLVRLAQGDAAGAAEDLREAVLQPSPPKFLHLATAELAAGDEAAARAALERSRRGAIDRVLLPPADRSRLTALEAALGKAAAPRTDTETE